MGTLVRRILHAIDNHGFNLAAVRALRRPEPSEFSHPFDQLHGVDTSGHIPGELLATHTLADLYNTAYFAISPSTLGQALRQLPLDLTQFTFVDLGCGKGRALLIAARFQFANILGIEISPALSAIAHTNTAPYANITIQTADAASLIYPSGPLVIFLYHPFLAPMLRRVLGNLLRQHTLDDLYVLAANPAYPAVFAHFPALVEQWTRDLTLSPEDRDAHPTHILFERYTLWHRVYRQAIARS